MPERESASPQHDPDARLGDLFENLPAPTQQLPAVDDSAPSPGSRRAAREAAGVQPATVDEVAPAAGSARSAAESPAAESPAADAPAAKSPAPESPSGRLEDLFQADHDDADLHPPKKKRRRGCLVALIIVLAVVGGLAVGGVWAWNTYGDRISEALGWGEPKDWEPGIATGEALVTIREGDTGRPVSTALHEAGVTRTEDVFYDYLIDEAIAVTFYPGVYRLQEKMTAEAALAALRDETNKLENTVGIAEGGTIKGSLQGMADTLGLPVEDFEAAVADPAAYGVAAQSLEGWLFPAIYTFDPDVTAVDVIARMVERTRESLAAAGVPDADAQRVLTVASIIQREARTADFGKVSRVIQNRIDIGMKLQMDSTAQYGYGSLHEGVVSSSAEALEDPNPWNTYFHEGLPVTPIASPSEAAIAAAMHPEEGPWLYFVTVDLHTGETQFSETYEEHQQGIDKWRTWCRANPDAGC